MREIKFRALDSVINRWLYFTLTQLICGHGRYNLRLKNWCEYTGLKDKNGKEIYEDDIDSKGRTVEYVTNMSGYYLMKKGEGWHLSHSQNVLKGCIKHIEIIGNKWENPELRKEKK